MVKTSTYFEQNGVKKGTWSEEEDDKLRTYIKRYGHWNWGLLPKFAGLSRTGKSCRLRWVNYLRPNMKHGNFTKEEDNMIAHLHNKLGNKWSAIASKLPGRSDNEIKNRWNTHMKKQAHDGQTVLEAANQKEIIVELEQQNGGEMNPTGTSSDSLSCSAWSELSSCWFSGSDCDGSSNLGSQTSNYQLIEDFWTEPFIEDITSSINNVLPPLNVVDDMMMNDKFSWSMLDSYLNTK